MILLKVKNLLTMNLIQRVLTFIPAFTGLGAPHWNSEIRGSIHGIQRDSSKED